MSSNLAILPATPLRGGNSRTRGGFARLLPKPGFIEQLRIEKQRAERADAPLSIVSLTLARETRLDSPALKPICAMLRENLRASDIIGVIDGKGIAILLPDTGANGAREVSRKLVADPDGPFSSALVGGYPDPLFNFIAGGDPTPTGSPGVADFPVERPWWSRALKRNLDILGAVVGLLVFSPVMAAIALAIKASSPGPVIFQQTRLGQHGIPFTFYKFRSMRADADDRIHRDYVARLIDGQHDQIDQGDGNAPLYKIKADPRITEVGKIIRKTSLDELPQFFNVLKGDMSLVGPRPAIAYEVEKYQAWHLRRVLEVKPGITGLWQVEGRSRTSFDDMVRMDIRYIDNMSLLLDLKILLKTFKVVFDCGGAV